MAATKVELSDGFKRDLDRCDTKFPGALDEVIALIEQLKQGQRPGDRVPKVGYTVFKVRLRNPAAKKGKSGGFRVIYYVKIANLVYLVAMYSKTKRENISSDQLRRIIEKIETE